MNGFHDYYITEDFILFIHTKGGLQVKNLRVIGIPLRGIAWSLQGSQLRASKSTCVENLRLIPQSLSSEVL